MATNTEIETARSEGFTAGEASAFGRLRTFTGIPDVVEPDPTLPEHLAYPIYERRLRDEIADERATIERLSDHERDAANELHTLVDRSAEQLERRKAGRTGLVRATGAIADRFHPSHRHVTDARREVEVVQQYLSHHIDLLTVLEAELERVSSWLDELHTAVATGQERRAAEERERAFDAETAARDISPRWCQVYTIASFIAENPEREARAWIGAGRPVVAGADFGCRWRRDNDEVRDDAQWSVHWIRETNETILELRNTRRDEIWLLGTAITSFDQALEVFAPIEPRQRERNSIALVLDTYADVAATVTGGRR